MPTATTRLRLPAAAPSSATPATLPGVLTKPGSRAAGAAPDPLLPDILTPLQSWRLAGTSRSDEAPAPEAVEADGRLLALEATDGTTLFIRADELAARLGRLALAQPALIGPDGAVDLAAFRPRDASSRGLGQWLWRQVTALAVKPDDITELARARASEWLGGKVEDLAVAGASTLGAKAIVSVIEERLAGPPGLYPWSGGALNEADRLESGAPRLAGLAGRPALSVSGYTDLAGMEIGVTRNTASGALVARFAPRARRVDFESDMMLIEAAAAGRLELFSTQNAVLDAVNQRAGYKMFEGKFVQQEMDVAIAMPRRERALRAWVNAWVFEQLRNGRLNEIYRRHHRRDLPAELRPARGGR